VFELVVHTMTDGESFKWILISFDEMCTPIRHEQV